MARKKGKPVSFDAMVKFFLKTYHIPTTRDVEKLAVRLDRIEDLIKAYQSSGRGRRTIATASSREKGTAKTGRKTASDVVLETIGKSKQGIGFSEIKSKTGYPEKKLRNIIFRLSKIGKIKRENRGIYVSA